MLELSYKQFKECLIASYLTLDPIVLAVITLFNFSML